MKQLILPVLFFILSITAFANAAVADEKNHVVGIDIDSPIVPGTEFIASHDFTFPADSNEMVLWSLNNKPEGFQYNGYKDCTLGYVQKPGDAGAQIIIPAHKHLKLSSISQTTGRCWKNNKNEGYVEGIDDVVRYEFTGAIREVYLSCENHQTSEGMVNSTVACNGDMISGRISYKDLMSKPHGVGIGFGIQYSAPKPPIPKKIPINYEPGTQNARVIDGRVKSKNSGPNGSQPSDKKAIPAEGRSAL